MENLLKVLQTRPGLGFLGGLGLELLLGLGFYMLFIRPVDLENIVLHKNKLAEQNLSQKISNNIESLKIKNLKDQPALKNLNDLLGVLPSQNYLESLIFVFSQEAEKFGLQNFKIGLDPSFIALTGGQEGLGLGNLNMQMEGRYQDFLNFYELGILKNYPVMKLKQFQMAQDLNSNLNKNLKIKINLEFVFLEPVGV